MHGEMNALVFDLGGTRLKAGVADRNARIMRSSVTDVAQTDGRDAILEAVRIAGRDMLGGTDARAVALCVPGLVDEGVLVSLPGKLPGLEGANLLSFLRQTFGSDRVAVTNDAIAYAIGEAVAGAGSGCQRSVVVTIGTGVGVTVIERGLPATGGMFGGGILGGFIPISDAGAAPDSNGHTGTIESLCAAARIVDACGGAYGSVQDVYAAHERGERQAIDGVAQYRIHLARALVALAHAHAPDRLILGGAPMHATNPVTHGLEELVNESLYGTYHVEVRLGVLGDDAALAGLAHVLAS